MALCDIADTENLCSAAIKAAKGKRTRVSVDRFFREFDKNISRLRDDIINGMIPCGHLRKFVIHNPKKRTIHAACFEDRVLHHAVMNFAGPVLDRAMVPFTYACREGKGTLKAVNRVQHMLRCHPWYVKIDIKGYFDAIDHPILNQTVTEKFKGDGFLFLIKRIIDSYHTYPGKGLPIGSLTSQHLANYYLDGLDRYIMETLGRPYVRYMDDMIWWCVSPDEARQTRDLVKRFAEERLMLEIKPSVQINRSRKGVTYCGYRVYPGIIKPGKRQLRRFYSRRKFWESRYADGSIADTKLQAAYASVHAVTVHTHSMEWRKRHFIKYPTLDV